ncbi:hypothetical protein BDZ97DRAFT_1112034 [Flammula alnicola]|nr:hypothetical protein BDZ97DRAFT_1112034 [Flammula alnicola]
MGSLFSSLSAFLDAANTNARLFSLGLVGRKERAIPLYDHAVGRFLGATAPSRSSWPCSILLARFIRPGIFSPKKLAYQHYGFHPRGFCACFYHHASKEDLLHCANVTYILYTSFVGPVHSQQLSSSPDSQKLSKSCPGVHWVYPRFSFPDAFINLSDDDGTRRILTRTSIPSGMPGETPGVPRGLEGSNRLMSPILVRRIQRWPHLRRLPVLSAIVAIYNRL